MAHTSKPHLSLVVGTFVFYQYDVVTLHIKRVPAAHTLRLYHPQIIHVDAAVLCTETNVVTNLNNVGMSVYSAFERDFHRLVS